MRIFAVEYTHMRAYYKYLLLLFCLLPVASPAVQAARCACAHHHCESHDAAGVHEPCCEAGGHGEAILAQLYAESNAEQRVDAPQSDTLVALPACVEHICLDEPCCGRIYLEPVLKTIAAAQSPAEGRAPPFFI